MNAIEKLIERLEYEIAVSHSPYNHWTPAGCQMLERVLKWATYCRLGDSTGEAPAGWRGRISNPPRHSIGLRVETRQLNSFNPSGWDPTALAARRWGLMGIIADVSDSHGVSYRVHHDDSTAAWYEHDELVPYVASSPPVYPAVQSLASDRTVQAIQELGRIVSVVHDEVVVELPPSAPAQPSNTSIDPVAEALVKGSLAVGTHGLPLDPPVKTTGPIEFDARTLALITRGGCRWTP